MSHLFTDDNPETTLKGLGFKTPEKTIESIEKIEEYFNNLEKNQPLNSYTPNNVRPKQYLQTKSEIHYYYCKQKMYRILGLLNRAKVVYKKTGSDKILASIHILMDWMDEYKKYKYYDSNILN